MSFLHKVQLKIVSINNDLSNEQIALSTCKVFTEIEYPTVVCQNTAGHMNLTNVA
jgi:hypothetical protein